MNKSMCTLDIVARITAGISWPDCPGQIAPLGNVVMLAAEDDRSDTIKPRLLAAGGDPSRVILITGVPRGGRSDAPFRLDTDLRHLATAIKKAGDVRAVIIDPISSYLGRTDSFRDSRVRELLMPLSGLAERHGIAVICVMHFNKSGGNKAIARVMGSLAFVAVARVVIAIVKDPNDQDRRLFLPVKSNISQDSTGLAFRIETVKVDKVVDPVPRIAWEDQIVNATIDEVLDGSATRVSSVPMKQRAADFLRAQLAKGPVAASVIHEMAAAARISKSALHRAKKQAGVVSLKQKDGWFLMLAKHETMDTPNC